MNVEIGAEAALFPEKEYINGIAVAVQCAMKSFLRMLSMQWNSFRICSAQHAMKLFPRMLSIRLDVHVKTVEIWTLAEHTQKFVKCILSVRWNCFLICSVWDKIVSMYAQHGYAIIFENYSKIPNKNASFDYKKLKFWKTVLERIYSNKRKIFENWPRAYKVLI